MRDLFSSGHIVDFILAVMVLEAIILVSRKRVTGRGMTIIEIITGLIPGACLLLAVRAALTEAWWGWIALSLTAAGISHASDLGLRLRRKD